MYDNFAVGDWVTGYRKGFFRVECVVRRFYEESHIGGVLGNHQIGEEMDPVLVLKRGFNSNLRRSIGCDQCSAALCRHLPPMTLKRIKTMLESDESLRTALDAYVIPPLSCLYNLGLNLQTPADHDLVQQIIPFVREGRLFREIAAKIEELGISKFKCFPHNATLQFSNHNYETVDKRLVYRDARLF